MEKKKVGFASGIGFILAAAGSAVGLGNLWGFPYKTSQNGGAAFVLIYIACVLLIGFVTMLSEIYLGRRAQANPITAYKMVSKNLGWCGLVAIMIPAFIICYYSVLVALCVAAYFLFFRNTDTGTNADEKLSGDYPV